MAECAACIRESILTFLGAHLEVTPFDDYCLVTLPLKTADDRSLDVFIEPKLGDFFLVHDGGKTAAELYAQGLHVEGARLRTMRAIAECYGATFDSGTFTIGCRKEGVQSAVMAVSQCASLAMVDVLSHQPVIEEEPVIARVTRTLDRWRPDTVDLQRRVPVKGRNQNVVHTFDFVAFRRDLNRRNVAVKVLTPTYSANVQAQRYGFLALDLEHSLAGEWPRLAIVSKADEWAPGALELVRSFSAHTVEVPGQDSEHRIERDLPQIMESIAAA
jgi:hypothetical protein